ncbi:MAG: TRAP transporter small permease [Oscillospiraceae bacterium]|nr:TRAP transporter small permease [Oscillospiraceae bacterium]
MKQFKSVKDKLFSVFLALGAVMLAVLILSCAIQVFTRYISKNPPGWTDELARFSFVWCSCLGAAVALDHGLHAGITLLAEHLPARGRRVQSAIIYAVVLVVMAVIARQGILLTKATVRTPSPALHLPMAYINVSIVVCGVGMAVACIYRVLEALFESDAEFAEEEKELKEEEAELWSD